MRKAWQHFWFREVPPHVYALMRILFGLFGCLSVLALHDLPAFWDPDGLVTGEAFGSKEYLVERGWGAVAGRLLFCGILTCFLGMTVGYQSRLLVPLSFIATVVQSSWNSLPLSSAHQVCRAALFGLMWVDCGAVWSVDSWLAGRRDPQRANQMPEPQPYWSLRLIQFQVALIYLNSGLWKLSSDGWRHGTTLRYVLNNNVFRRVPQGLPPELDPLATWMTYIVLLWELAFAPMLFFRRTRYLALATGVMLHLGMWTLLELGPFSWMMLASYCAFLDPVRFASKVDEFRRRLTVRR